MNIVGETLRRLCRQPVRKPAEPAALTAARDCLMGAAIPAEDVRRVRRQALSTDGRFCAMTLENHESYVVDMQQPRYAHFPTAGVCGFAGSAVVLEPDEARFSLEYSGFDRYEVDLLSAEVPWQAAGKASNPPC
jgi:hypothetical protein